jgi:hypothetical protein
MKHPGWKDQAATVMTTVYLREASAGASKREIVRAIDDAYPFGERTRYPYRCWLKVRREFLVDHFLSDGTGARLRNRQPPLPAGQRQLSLIPPRRQDHNAISKGTHP